LIHSSYVLRFLKPNIWIIYCPYVYWKRVDYCYIVWMLQNILLRYLMCVFGLKVKTINKIGYVVYGLWLWLIDLCMLEQGARRGGPLDNDSFQDSGPLTPYLSLNLYLCLYLRYRASANFITVIYWFINVENINKILWLCHTWFTHQVLGK